MTVAHHDNCSPRQLLTSTVAHLDSCSPRQLLTTIIAHPTLVHPTIVHPTFVYPITAHPTIAHLTIMQNTKNTNHTPWSSRCDITSKYVSNRRDMEMASPGM